MCLRVLSTCLYVNKFLCPRVLHMFMRMFSHVVGFFACGVHLSSCTCERSVQMPPKGSCSGILFVFKPNRDGRRKPSDEE